MWASEPSLNNFTIKRSGGGASGVTCTLTIHAHSLGVNIIIHYKVNIYEVYWETIATSDGLHGQGLFLALLLHYCHYIWPNRIVIINLKRISSVVLCAAQRLQVAGTRVCSVVPSPTIFR